MGKNILLYAVLIILCSCCDNREEHNNVVFSLVARIKANEFIPNSDYIFQNQNLKNIFYPHILDSNLVSANYSNDDFRFYLDNLRNMVITDSIKIRNIDYFYTIFEIAENQMQYAQKDSLNVNETVLCFGYSILSELTKSLEYNINQGNIEKRSPQMDTLLHKLEKYDYYPDFHISRAEKLKDNIKKGNWSYIIKRARNQMANLL